MNLLEVTPSMGPNHAEIYVCVCVLFWLHVEFVSCRREYFRKNMYGNKGAKDGERPKGWTVIAPVVYKPFWIHFHPSMPPNFFLGNQLFLMCSVLV